MNHENRSKKLTVSEKEYEMQKSYVITGCYSRTEKSCPWYTGKEKPNHCMYTYNECPFYDNKGWTKGNVLVTAKVERHCVSCQQRFTTGNNSQMYCSSRCARGSGVSMEEEIRQIHTNNATLFVQQCCDENKAIEESDYQEKMSDLYDRYISWSKDAHRRAMSKKMLGVVLTDIGYPSHRGTSGVRHRLGLSIKS